MHVVRYLACKSGKPAYVVELIVYYYVYLLVSRKDKHYIGCTNNIKDRLSRHNSGQVEATRRDKPWKLKSCFIFDDEHNAFEFEQYLKTGAGRGFLKRHV